MTSGSRRISTQNGHNYETLVDTDMDLQTELQRVKLSMRKLQEDKDLEITEIRHGREKDSNGTNQGS